MQIAKTKTAFALALAGEQSRFARAELVNCISLIFPGITYFTILKYFFRGRNEK